MDAEQMAVVARAEKMLADPATYEATLRQVALERLVIRARADMMNEAEAKIEQRRRESEQRALALAQGRFDRDPPASLTGAADFFGGVLGWKLRPVKFMGRDGWLPVGDGGGKVGQNIVDDRAGDEPLKKIMLHGGAYGVDVQASRLAVLVVEPDGAAAFAEIERFFKLPVSLGWRVDGTEYRAYAGGRVGEWVDGMALADGVRLETVGVVRLPPSAGCEWATTPRTFYKSLAGTSCKSVPVLSPDMVQLARDLRNAPDATRRRYVAMLLSNAAEREAAGTKGKSRK